MLHEEKAKGKSKKAKEEDGTPPLHLLPFAFLLLPYFSPPSCV
jgi:hypothetical protein